MGDKMTKAEALAKFIEDQWDDLIWNYSDEEKLDFILDLADRGYLQINDIFYLEYMENILNRYFSDQFSGLE